MTNLNSLNKAKIIAANWKMNLRQKDIQAFCQEIRAFFEHHDRPIDAKIILFPPVPYLTMLVSLLQNLPIEIGCQNIFHENRGSYTGEVSAEMVAELGARYVLIGHSERRKFFQETDNLVNKKIHAALEAGLSPILCCGETLAEKQSEVKDMAVVDHIETSLQGLSSEQVRKMVIAYEPDWAVGTGKNLEAEAVGQVIELIKRVLVRNWPEDGSQQIPILYGGSVNADNFNDYFGYQGIDGILVGSASQNVKSMLKMVAKAIS